VTREQKVKAFEMRIDGYTYAEIANRFGVSRQYIHQILTFGVEKPIQKGLRNCVYYNIAQWITNNNLTIPKLCKMMGRKPGYHQALRNKLTGITEFSISEIKLILALTGMEFDEAFAEKENPQEAATSQGK
jgi:hypothetical protein